MSAWDGFITDHQVNQANRTAVAWQHAQQQWQIRAENLERQLIEVEAQKKELEESNAANLALRYALANQLAALDPQNPLIENPELVEKIKNLAVRSYSIGNSFDDARWVGNGTTIKRKFDRNYFIQIAYNAALFEALKLRLNIHTEVANNYDVVVEKYHLKFPQRLLELVGDTENPVLTKEFRDWFVERAGLRYDKFLAEGGLEKSPDKSPYVLAVSAGKELGYPTALHQMSCGMDIDNANFKRGYTPPADLYP